MNLTKIARGALLGPLSAVSGITSSNSPLPILSNVLLEAGDGKLRVTASNLDIQISAESEVPELTKPQAVTVPAKKLQDILRALPDVPVTLEGDGNRLTVKAGRSRHKLQTMPALDFPRAQAASVDTKIMLLQRDLATTLRLVAFAMAKRDIRYYLVGALLCFADGKLTAIGTDGHRLAYADTPVDVSSRHEIIVPAATVQELLKHIDGDESITLEVLSNNMLRARFGAMEIVSKLVDGKFPQWDRVLPAKPPQHATFDRKVLLDTLKRAAILADDRTREARLSINAEGLRIACVNTDAEEAEEVAEIQYAGAPHKGGWNIDYLIEVLSTYSTSEVAIGFDEGHHAFFTVPGRDDFRSVVVGMRY